MSTLATNAITDASGGNTATINSYTPTESNMAGRNRIINGDMRIDQRNAGASVTVNSTTVTHPVDRFFGQGQSTDGVFTLQQSSTAPAGFSTSVVATVTTADASVGTTQFYLFGQRIEGFNTSDLSFGTASAKTVTLSFWTRSSLTGTFGGVLTNDGFTRSYPFTYSISVADTWEYKTVTIAGDTTGTWVGSTNGVGLRIFWGLGVGADRSGTADAWAGVQYLSATGAVSVIGTLNATWYVTGVQLEAGSVATPFERRQYGQELALCQRYFEKSYNADVAPGSASTIGYSSLSNSDQGSAVYLFNTDRFRVEKRTAATMILWDLAGTVSRTTQYTLGGLGRTDGANNVYSYTGAQTGAVMIAVQAASTAGTYHWTASAEL
jgi:hypothetical protein